MLDESTIPPGYCQCGCGGKTRVATRNEPRFGVVKGTQRRYLQGHHARREAGRGQATRRPWTHQVIQPAQARPLTQRERETGEMLVAGVAPKQIALHLGVSHSTVRSTMHRIRAAVGMTGWGMAALIATLTAHGYLLERPPRAPEDDEGPLAPGWKAYLAAFERLQSAREPDEIHRRAREMRLMSIGGQIDADHSIPSRRAPLPGSGRPLSTACELLNSRDYAETLAA